MKLPFFVMFGVSILYLACNSGDKSSQSPKWLAKSVVKMEDELLDKYGHEGKSRIQKGLKQVANYWQSKDGTSEIFEEFIQENFIHDPERLDALFFRFENHMESLYGHMDRILLNLREQADLDQGPIYPFDEFFAAYNPGAHIIDDFFKNRLAFVVLLNFPLTTLDERSTYGLTWSRRQWAETRLASIFIQRVPPEISLEISRISSQSDQYISEYNIWMHHLVDEKGMRMFPPKLRLLSHWNLRDELKAQYAKGADGLLRQRMIQRVMERIVDQTIPESVINNPALDWDPFNNTVTKSVVEDAKISETPNLDITGNPEPNTRYRMLQQNFIVQKSADPFWPTVPNFIKRRFDQGRELPEERVVDIFKKVLTSPHFKTVSTLISKRLGRELEPFDIWYSGFRASSEFPEEKLNKIVSSKYPDAIAFKEDIPRMLRKLGFFNKRSVEISRLIVVDPARGSGHAWGAQMRGAKTHLRTRIGAEGMDYKGYNIAVHELGHNVEQVISTNNIDYTLLHGVPNNAFTEALAFVFQSRDLELLDLSKKSTPEDPMNTINDFWGTCEIAGVAMVDLSIWHWMYEHPQATPAELRDATLTISKDIWNTYFSPVFQHKDVILLGIYSHMISYPLYLADYPLGHMIAYQIEEKMKSAKSVGEEFDRMARLGNIAPDLWMIKATGEKVGPEALLSATELALDKISDD